MHQISSPVARYKRTRCASSVLTKEISPRNTETTGPKPLYVELEEHYVKVDLK
jgi:hypothetical protein